MNASIRWTVTDRYGNSIYLTQERWEHIIEPINHSEMAHIEDALKKTIQNGIRRQDALNPRKFRYSLEFPNLPLDNTHVVAIVLFSFRESESGDPLPNNYIVTAYLKEIR